MMMKVQNLGFDINGKALLQDMSFEVPEGSLFVILGPNGAGKTLLLRCLAGLAKPTRGAITQMETSSAWVPLSQSLPFGFRVFDLVLMGRYAIQLG
ncbi:MAG: ABC transporter ATP-binding protein, partial [Proteobacteria bacterium]